MLVYSLIFNILIAMEKKKQPKADFSKPIKIHDKESIQRLKEAARCAAEVISLTEKAIVVYIYIYI